VIAWAALTAVGQGHAAPPLSAAGLSNLSIEELADIEVSSVSRRPEPLADAPASVYVITGEDIVGAGVLSLPEALRLAPNLQVARINANSYAISARGSNNSSGNKLLVMIDGRSVYTPLHSGVFWDAQEVLLADIDRIEVISGPGGTLWGANAVNGVINIVTRSSRDTLGSLGVAAAGTEERSAALRHGLRLGAQASVRLYAKASRYDATQMPSGAPVVDAWRMNQVGFRSDGGHDGANTWTLQGDAYDGSAESPGGLGRKTSGANLLGRLNRDFSDGANLQVQTYFDRYSRRQPGLFTESLDTFDLDVQYRFQAGRKHEVVLGGGVRDQRDQTTGSALLAFIPADNRLNRVNLFAQDTVALTERLKLTFGAKLERNNYTGLEFQPNLRLAWKVNERRLLWSAVSRAVRTPSRLDRDLFVPGNLGPPYNGPLNGGPGFASERLTAYEIGYRAQPTAQTSFTVSAFYDDYDRLRSIEPAGQGGYVLGNKVRLHATGLEMWGNLQVDARWRLSAGYAALNERWRFASGSGDPGSPSTGGNDPRHRATLRSHFNLPRNVSLDLALRAVSALPNPAVPGYVEVDARTAWAISNTTEISLAAFNLLDAHHVEFGGGPGVSDLRRRFSLRLLARF
jgi:iron complex outermembrane receptor protein